MKGLLSKYRVFGVCVALVLVTLAVYGQVYRHEFVNYDDPRYVTENKHVRAGLTQEGVKWAFAARYASNWHPLTWLSHMLDCELFGLNAGGHHLVNLLFHLANTVLLLVVFQRMTRALWQSAFVAALFALHPLHTESVAWVAERKDVLSTFLWLLTLWAYVRYIERQGLIRYALVVILFGLGLMAKPMLVTLPFVLLLLDYWPLGRFGTEVLKVGSNRRGPQTQKRAFWGPRRKARAKNGGYRTSTFLPLVVEKAPLFVLAAVSSVVTLLVQQGMVVSLRGLDLHTRIANALVSYVVYFGKMIWPLYLAVFYPHSRTVAVWQGVGAGLVLIVLSVLVIWRKHHRYAAVGWLWYLGTLVPVIGLVQVGIQRHADRYTYVPLIGPFIVIAWGSADLLRDLRYRKAVLGVSAAVVLSVLTVCTWFQAGYWRSDITLYEHALAVTERNHLAHNNLGVALKKQGRIDEAVRHWETALEIYPRYSDAVANLGSELVQKGRIDEAIGFYAEFLRHSPGNCQLHNNLANALKTKGRIDEAIKHYRRALELRPDAWQAHYNLGMILGEKGNFEEAVKHLKMTVLISPRFSRAHSNLARALVLQGKFDEAVKHYREALRMDPNDSAARNGLKTALAKQRKLRKR